MRATLRRRWRTERHDAVWNAVSNTAICGTSMPAAFAGACSGASAASSYGFHGTSHQYVHRRAAGVLPEARVIFTAGVGENSAGVRARVVAGLERMGVELDAAANARATAGHPLRPDGDVLDVATAASRVRVLVVATDGVRAVRGAGGSGASLALTSPAARPAAAATLLRWPVRAEGREIADQARSLVLAAAESGREIVCVCFFGVLGFFGWKQRHWARRGARSTGSAAAQAVRAHTRQSAPVRALHTPAKGACSPPARVVGQCARVARARAAHAAAGCGGGGRWWTCASHLCAPASIFCSAPSIAPSTAAASSAGTSASTPVEIHVRKPV